jgi:ribosomal protein L40E
VIRAFVSLLVALLFLSSFSLSSGEAQTHKRRARKKPVAADTTQTTKVTPVQPTTQETRVCPRCGTINPKENNFCKKCGFNFASATQEKKPVQAGASKKEPVLSWALSFFLLPGLGQFYNGDGGKGAAQLIIYTGATVLWAANMPRTESTYAGGYYIETTSGNQGLFTAGLCVAGATWLWSWIDAPMSSSRKNRENGFSLRSPPNVDFTLKADPRRPQKLQVGLALSKRF